MPNMRTTQYRTCFFGHTVSVSDRFAHVNLSFYLVGSVSFLLCNIQIFVNFVQQPQEKLLCVVLRKPSVLRSEFSNNVFEVAGNFWLVHPSPQALQQLRQLLCKFSSRSESPRVDSVVPLDILFVLISHEVLGQQLCVAQTLQNCIHETCVAMVLDAHNPWQRTVPVEFEWQVRRLAVVINWTVIKWTLDWPKFTSCSGPVHALASPHGIRHILHHSIHELLETRCPWLFLPVECLCIVVFILQRFEFRRVVFWEHRDAQTNISVCRRQVRVFPVDFLLWRDVRCVCRPLPTPWYSIFHDYSLWATNYRYFISKFQYFVLCLAETPSGECPPCWIWDRGWTRDPRQEHCWIV